MSATTTAAGSNAKVVDLCVSRTPQSMEQSLMELAAYAREHTTSSASVPSFPAPQFRLDDPAHPDAPPPVWPAWDRPIPPCIHPTALSACPPDAYGQGALTQHFEAHIANVFGKESALFCTTGTMAQQVALRVHAQGKNKIFACAPKCHMLLHESNAYDVLQGFSALSVGLPGRVMSCAQLEAALHKHWKCPSVLVLELPERELGGQSIPWEELVDMRKLCDTKGIRMHLDGARIWEIAPWYKRSLQEIASLFDSIYVSFYKGLGGSTGSMLIGSAPFITAAKPWVHRMGGRLWQAWPMVLAAQRGFNQNVNRMHSRGEKMRAIVAAVTRAQEEFVARHREELAGLFGAADQSAAAAAAVPSREIAAPGNATASAAAAAASAAAASSAAIAAPAPASSSSPALPAQPFFRFIPAVPTCPMVHLYIHMPGPDAEALRASVLSDTGVSVFARLRGSSARECVTEISLGGSNDGIEVGEWVRGWEGFMRARVEQLRHRQQKP